MTSPNLVKPVDSNTFRNKITEHYAKRGLILPEVRVVPVKKPTRHPNPNGLPVRSIQRPSGYKIGEYLLAEQECNGRTECFFSPIEIDPYKEGYGVAVYREAICEALDAGKDFRTDPSGLSGGSFAMWQRLAALGLASAISAPTLAVQRGQVNYWHAVVTARGQA